jgi:hypothetical protein
MRQKAPFAMRLFLCLLCCLIAWVACSVAWPNGIWSGQSWLLPLIIVFICLVVASFTHPYSVLSFFALVIGALGLHVAVANWDSGQLIPATLGVTILCFTYLLLRSLEKRKQISPAGLVIYGGAVTCAVVVGAGLFGYSSFGFICISLFFAALGVAGIATTLIDLLAKRRGP